MPTGSSKFAISPRNVRSANLAAQTETEGHAGTNVAFLTFPWCNRAGTRGRWFWLLGGECVVWFVL